MLFYNKLEEQLNLLEKEDFTGQITIKSNNNILWTLYFCEGRIVWADGGIHRNRAWLRCINKFLPNLKINEINAPNSVAEKCPQYHTLTIINSRKLVNRTKIKELIYYRIQEILFDLIQYSQRKNLDFHLKKDSLENILTFNARVPIAMINIQSAFQVAKQSWHIWEKMGLKTYTPDMAVIIKEKNFLRHITSDILFVNFTRIIDSKKTLRDLATQLKQDVIKSTCSLIPYLKKGIFELRNTKDIKHNNHLFITNNAEKNDNNSCLLKFNQQNKKPLISCLDDSQQIIRIMEKIIIQDGYRFIGVDNALKALPILINYQPDLIFLDVSMPIMNGYEVCRRLKRISKLKNTPVIFLTGNDGMIDRLKAKAVGASYFLSKPINVDQIQQTVSTFLDGEQQARVS